MIRRAAYITSEMQCLPLHRTLSVIFSMKMISDSFYENLNLSYK